MEIDKFLFALDLRTGALVGGGLQIILGPLFYIHCIPLMSLYFWNNLLTGVSICFVYFLISLVAGLFLIFGSFRYNPSYVLIHQIASAIGTVMLFASIVMTFLKINERQVMQNDRMDGIGIIYIIALLGLVVCLILQVCLTIGSTIFRRKLKTGKLNLESTLKCKI